MPTSRALLTKLTVRNFKRFESAAIELGNPVVFIGPNNSGKRHSLSPPLTRGGSSASLCMPVM